MFGNEVFNLIRLDELQDDHVIDDEVLPLHDLREIFIESLNERFHKQGLFHLLVFVGSFFSYPLLSFFLIAFSKLQFHLIDLSLNRLFDVLHLDHRMSTLSHNDME